MSTQHESSAAYVRTEMVEPSPPPASTVGVVGWVRENLFSSIINTVLTIIGVLVVGYALWGLLPWFFQSVWTADSLAECREIRDITWGQDATYSCFAVISDRWHQLMFGFYPADAYWRPVLAFIIFLLAMAPVLFSHLPRKLLYVTAAFPFVSFFLFWGGSIWGPIAVALGFGIGYVVMTQVSKHTGTLVAFIAAVIVPILYWLFVAESLVAALHSVIPIGLEFVPSDDFGGFMLAFIIGIAGILLSLPLGVVLALGRQSNLFIINKSCVVFIEVIRGVPLIVWLFTASLLLNYFLPPGTNFDLMLRVIIMVTLFSAAYIAEVVRGGLAALPRGQYEAADSLGLDYWKSMRLIILPQALKISIPGIVNSFIGLFKDSVLVVFIGMLDPIGFSNAIRATTDWNGVYWELFVFIGLCFFICCFSMSRYSMYLEKKLHTGHR